MLTTPHLLWLSAAVLLMSLITTPVGATTIVVNTVTDELNQDGDCSLREAIQAANTDQAVDACPAGSGADTIQLGSSLLYSISIPGSGEDNNATGDFDLSSDIEIIGFVGTTFVSAGEFDRVFHIHSGAVVTLRQLVIQDGKPVGSGGGVWNQGTMILDTCKVTGNNGVSGGGISSGGITTIKNSSIVDNVASGGGGGISHALGDRLVIVDSTLSGNQASTGGGLFVAGLEMLRSTVTDNYASGNGGGVYKITGSIFDSIVNSTVSGNRSDASGGGIFIQDLTFLLLASSTVALNEADFDDVGSGSDGGDGGGIFVVGSSNRVKLHNTIVAKNEDGSSGTFEPYAPDCDGDITSLGYNLFGALDTGLIVCSFSGPATDDLIGLKGTPLDPSIGILAENGGPTRTHALISNSPAIDAGDPSGCIDENGDLLHSDQRLKERTFDGPPNRDPEARCDIGAYEYGAGPAKIIFTSGFE